MPASNIYTPLIPLSRAIPRHCCFRHAQHVNHTMLIVCHWLRHCFTNYHRFNTPVIGSLFRHTPPTNTTLSRHHTTFHHVIFICHRSARLVYAIRELSCYHALRVENMPLFRRFHATPFNFHHALATNRRHYADNATNTASTFHLPTTRRFVTRHGKDDMSMKEMPRERAARRFEPPRLKSRTFAPRYRHERRASAYASGRNIITCCRKDGRHARCA